MTSRAWVVFLAAVVLLDAAIAVAVLAWVGAL